MSLTTACSHRIFSGPADILPPGGIDSAWKQRACYKVNHNLSLDEWHRYLGDRPYEKTCPDLPVGEGVE
jgi:hypothetical protein